MAIEDRLNRALTVNDVLSANINRFPFDGEWKEAFGNPQAFGTWAISGGSGHGKTTFILKLIKKICEYDKVLFESYEEGKVSGNMQRLFSMLNMSEVQRKLLVEEESIEDLEKRLLRKKSPRVVVLDSATYVGFRGIKQFVSFERKFPRNLFIVLCQMDGNKPKTKFESDIIYHANQKIMIEGYRAFNRGRSQGEKGYYTIWEKGARDYWDYK